MSFWKHGQHGSLTYKVWCGMRQRCMNPRNPRFKDYGGRGIKVCKRWCSFVNFWGDMGEKPAGMQLDRVNNDGDYELKNCKWATRKEQHNNTRRSRMLRHGRKTMTLSQWVDALGANYSTISKRLGRGWSVEDVLTVPIQKHRKAGDQPCI